MTTKQGTRNDAPILPDLPSGLRPRPDTRSSILSADSHRRVEPLDEQGGYREPRQVVSATHILHILGGIVLAVVVFAVLGLVDSPNDHREPVMVREVQS